MLECGEADNDRGVCLPDHVPEVPARLLRRVLADDELSRSVVARHPAGVDIVPTGCLLLATSPS